MFDHRLPTDPFFAHLRACDLECPRCGAVFTLTPSAKHDKNVLWDSYTNRFRCRACGLTLGLGVLAWPLAPGLLLRADDSVPSPRQARALAAAQQAARRQAGGFLVDTETPRDNPIARIRGRRPRNVVLAGECRCQSDLIHPDCPAHGAGPRT